MKHSTKTHSASIADLAEAIVLLGQAEGTQEQQSSYLAVVQFLTLEVKKRRQDGARRAVNRRAHTKEPKP